MLPSELTAAQFAHYPPQARALAVGHLPLLRALPPAFLPSLLREIVGYDVQFPAERAQMERQLGYLAALPVEDRTRCFARFAAVRVSAEQIARDWAGQPLEFTEQFSAYLWQTHQMDAFREAALAYGLQLQAALPAEALPMPRLGIAVVGQGATAHGPAALPVLFSRLREHGTLFTNVDPAGGLAVLVAAVEARARRQPGPYAHWYIDGGEPLEHTDAVTAVSYARLAPARAALFAHIGREVSKPGMGPEQLRDHLARLSPVELGLRGDPVLDRFQVAVLTEGSGTQIFSTTFAQWTAREALRRAAPLTLLVRFAPRQRQRPMNELLAGDEGTPQLDPEGSLVDAEMAAYYQWINQQRLPGAPQGSFLVWLEGGRQALVAGPGLPKGTASHSGIDVAGLLKLVTT